MLPTLLMARHLTRVLTWTGTLTLPGRDFDVTAPSLAGAVSKSVRAAKGAAMPACATQ